MCKQAFCLFCFCLVVGVSTATAAPGDFVVGAGRLQSLDVKVEIMARSDADGADATGRFRIRQGPTFDIIGEVTCLAVSGDHAAAGGVIVQSSDPSRLGDTFFQIVRDNGEGQDDNDESQTILGLPNADPAVCAIFLGFDPAFTIDRGNYEVKDR
jgi:hypothetical protein